jgi:putative transposase
MKFDPQMHNRHSRRLQGYDYAQCGAYFITLVTYHRDELFGRIVNVEMQLSNLGQIVYEEWNHSNNIRKEISIHNDEFVIMLNHLHGIVWINNESIIVEADGVRPNNEPIIVGAVGVRSNNDDLIDNGIASIEGGIMGASLAPIHAPVHQKPDIASIRRKPRSLSSFVAGFKSAVTARAGRELNISRIWQRNY